MTKDVATKLLIDIDEITQSFAKTKYLCRKQVVNLLNAIFTYLMKYAEPKFAECEIINMTIHCVAQAIAFHDDSSSSSLPNIPIFCDGKSSDQFEKRKHVIPRSIIEGMRTYYLFTKIPYYIKDINAVTAKKRTQVKRNMNGENGQPDYHVFTERFFVSLEGNEFKNIRQLTRKLEKDTMDLLKCDKKLLEDRYERQIAQMMPYLRDPLMEVPARANTSSVVIEKLRAKDPFMAATDEEIRKIVERRRDAIKNARDTELNKIVRRKQPSLFENIPKNLKTTKKAVKKVLVNDKENFPSAVPNHEKENALVPEENGDTDNLPHHAVSENDCQSNNDSINPLEIVENDPESSKVNNQSEKQQSKPKLKLKQKLTAAIQATKPFAIRQKTLAEAKDHTIRLTIDSRYEAEMHEALIETARKQNWDGICDVSLPVYGRSVFTLKPFERNDIIVDYHGLDIDSNLSVAEYVWGNELERKSEYIVEVQSYKRKLIDASSDICPQHGSHRCLGRLCNYAYSKELKCNMQLTEIICSTFPRPDNPKEPRRISVLVATQYIPPFTQLFWDYKDVEARRMFAEN